MDRALEEFTKAHQIDPSSAVAAQEVETTRQMVQGNAPPGERGLTPAEQARKANLDKLDRILPIPDLDPLTHGPINLQMTNQSPRVLFETVGKYAGINVLFDPEYQPGKAMSVELRDATIEQAFDSIGLLTKSFWKALSPSAIFVTNDNTNKRHEYEEQVARVFYLANVNTAQELQEIMNAVRSVTELQRIVQYNSLYAIVARGEADKIMLAEKVIRDLDKPRAEVVVDFLVIEASKTFSRQVTAAIASTGLNVPVNFSPRSGLQIASSTTSTTSSSTSTSSTTSSSSSSSGTSAVSLASLNHLSSADFSVTLPGALLQAALSDANTRILQAPQLRSVDGAKASLKIGNREPTATGSYSAGTAATTVNALVNTQFTYIDVGVNVDMTVRVHDDGDVSLHVELDISSVDSYVNLGGVNEPVIGQRKVVHDIRMREGEVNLLAGLVNQQDSKTVTGIPGLSSIPLLRRLFTGESVDRSRTDLMIALVPHVIRKPDVSVSGMRGVAVGSGTPVKLNYAPRKETR